MITTIDLEKSLVRNKRKMLTKEEILVLDKVEKVESDKDLELLRQRLGMWEDNAAVAKVAREKLFIQNKFPSDRVFSESDIKSLCCKYGLRFLPSNLFNGELDSELPTKIKQFETKYNVYVGKHNTFIAAPAKSFKLSERPKDPLFFIQLDSDVYSRNEKHYFLVHKWGNDISITRWFANLFLRNTWTKNLVFFGSVFLIASMLGYSHSVCDCAGKGNAIGGAIMTGFLACAGGFFLILLGGLASDNFLDDGGPLLSGNDNKWNSKYIK